VKDEYTYTTGTMPPSIDAIRMDSNIIAIADRIDAEHERLMRERKGCIHYDQERHYCNVHDLTTDEHYQLLPVDADGVPIHIGDVMDSKVDYLFDGRPFYVRALVLCEDGWDVADGRFGNRYEPNSLRHHHAPTVEDVLREMCLEIDRRCERGSIDYDKLFAKYAAKLRLAGDAE
jgi:hypothetical protein